jgi:hypothetical protein
MVGSGVGGRGGVISESGLKKEEGPIASGDGSGVFQPTPVFETLPLLHQKERTTSAVPGGGTTTSPMCRKRDESAKRVREGEEERTGED